MNNQISYKNYKHIFERKLINMQSNVGAMFYVRQTPWHALGVKVKECLYSKEALENSVLN